MTFWRIYNEKLENWESAKKAFNCILTDPPYHLTTISSKAGTQPTSGLFHRISHQYREGILGKQWDGGEIAFKAETWAKLYEVCTDNAQLLAFSHSRLYHKTAMAIQAGGWTLGDPFIWRFLSGFPKARPIAPLMQRRGYTEAPLWADYRYGTQVLKPAYEPIVFAYKGDIPKMAFTEIRSFYAPKVSRKEADLGLEKTTLSKSGFSLDTKAGVNFTGGDGSPRKIYLKHNSHPTLKPIQLIKQLAELFEKRDSVLIPFSGSGSEMIACSLAGFNVIHGIEQDADYAQIAELRLNYWLSAQTHSQEALF